MYRGAADFQIADRVIEVAEKYGKSTAQISVAWQLSKPGVACPVVGVSKVSQVNDLVGATQMKIEDEDIAYLEALTREVTPMFLISGYVLVKPAYSLSFCRLCLSFRSVSIRLTASRSSL